MAGRLNKVIELLEAGQVVFGGGMVWTGNADEAMAYADLGYDFIIFEMEHEGFDLPGLRHSLQSLLNRKQIVAQGLPAARLWYRLSGFRQTPASATSGSSNKPWTPGCMA